MKKLVVVLLALALLLLSACSAKTNKLYDIKYQISEPPYEYMTVVTEKEKYSTEDTVIEYSITNTSDKKIGICEDSQCFVLHKLENGEWKYVGTKIEHEWGYSALILSPNQTETREINLEKYYHLPLEKGVYRIYIDTEVSNTFEIS